MPETQFRKWLTLNFGGVSRAGGRDIFLQRRSFCSFYHSDRYTRFNFKCIKLEAKYEEDLHRNPSAFVFTESKTNLVFGPICLTIR
jgi:hypothetical protein